MCPFSISFWDAAGALCAVDRHPVNCMRAVQSRSAVANVHLTVTLFMKKQKQQPVRQKHMPQRTCVVCRQKTDKRSLIRIVRTPDAGVVVDPTGKRNGRGAYVCDRSACWDQLLTGQILQKALKANVSDDELAAIAAQRPATPATANDTNSGS